MARTNSTAQNKIDPTRPFFAAVGSVDAAVAYARSGFTGAQSRLEQAQSRLAKVDFEPRALADGLQKEALALPGRVETLVNETVDDLNQQYVELAARGRTLVNRIRRQQATQDLQAEARSTVTRAKTTRTQTRKAASTAKSSAKATGTTARKTATAAKKATRSSASKVGTGKTGA